MKTTRYFDATRIRTDRAGIKDAWIEAVIQDPIRELTQADGRIQRWGAVPEEPNRYLRVVLLDDAVTVHNAFFDRRFKP